jgi:hypothetical protein
MTGVKRLIENSNHNIREPELQYLCISSRNKRLDDALRISFHTTLCQMVFEIFTADPKLDVFTAMIAESKIFQEFQGHGMLKNIHESELANTT